MGTEELFPSSQELISVAKKMFGLPCEKLYKTKF